jgi:hypothetical protein
LLRASVDILNRKILAAVGGFLFGAVVASASYLGWKALFEGF